MTPFLNNQLKQALIHAEAGGQSLLACKRRRGRPDSAMLIDHDNARLWATARRLGSPCVMIHRGDMAGQHVILTGRNLAKARAEAATREFEFA